VSSYRLGPVSLQKTGMDQRARAFWSIPSPEMLQQLETTTDDLSQGQQKDRKIARGYISAFWTNYSVARKYLDTFLAELKEKEPEGRVGTS
jgi:hypothetical protein